MKLKKLFPLLLGMAVVWSCSKEEKEAPTPTPNTNSTCFNKMSYTDQLPNLDFESWGSPSESAGKYEEPCGGIWASGNPGTALSGQYTTSKTSDAQHGNYAARMQTKSALGTLSAGSIFAGSFKLDLDNPDKSAIRGVPFTHKPASFQGYYKYTSVNGDSASIVVLLTKYNNATKVKDTVAYGILTEYTSITTYTLFDIPLDYGFSTGVETPDSLELNFASSKAGESFKGEVGSTLFIDNCQFVY